MLVVEEAMWPLCLEGIHTPYPPCVCAIFRDGNRLNEGIPSDGHRQPCIAVIWIFYRFVRPLLFDSYFPYVLWATKFRNRRDRLSLFSYGVDRSPSPPVMHIVQELTVTNTDNPGIRNVLVSNCALCTLPPDCRAFLKCQVWSIVTWQRMPQKWSVRLVLTFHHSLLQEVACNHAQSVGFSTDGFATTPLMRERGFIWVTTRMKIKVDKYPVW